MQMEYPEITPTFPTRDWSLPAVLAQQARSRGDKVFLRWMPDNSTVTFRQAHERSSQLARGLQAIGVAKGERVVVMMANCVDHLMAWFALAKLGAVDTPVNTAYIGDLLVHQMNLVGAKYVVIDAKFLGQLKAVTHRLAHLRSIIVRDDGCDEKAPAGSLEVIEFRSLVGAPGDANHWPRVMDEATILCTSGTTGPSKGVVLSHGQMYFFAEQIVQVHRLSDADTMVAPLPLFHVSGRVCGAYACLVAGATYAMYEKFSGSRFVERLHETCATTTHMIGAMVQKAFGCPPSAADRGHKLRSVFAAPTPHDIADAFVRRFGIEQIVEGLGQTEVCQPVLTPPGVPRPQGAAGVLMSQYFEARIVDPATDEELPDGEVGEYVVRPKKPWLTTLGYEGMPEKSLEATRNLWFHTGDAARRDAQGWFYFVDRMKDCIRRRGENVSSYEVEAVLQQHPAVREVAAFAVKADAGDSEDEVMVAIVAEGSDSDFVHELIEWAQERLPNFAVPRFYRLMAQLPKTPNDKVQKVKLRSDGVTVDTFDRSRAGGRALAEASSRS